jgi:hypothetical protein
MVAAMLVPGPIEYALCEQAVVERYVPSACYTPPGL